MSNESGQPLTFDTLLNDPLTRLLMQADRVSPGEMASVLHVARRAVMARQRVPGRTAPVVRLVECEPA